MTTRASPNLTSMLHAGVAGFVDTLGYVTLFGLFTAHVTGNIVLLGASLAAPAPGTLAKLLALPTFVLAVAATGLFLRRCKGRDAEPARGLLLAQAVLLACFLASGVSAGPFTDGDAPAAVLTGLLGVAAMAVQNAASRTVFATLSPTTVMTGNVSQVVLDLLEVLPGGSGDPAARNRIAKMTPPVLAFVLGAAAGGLGFRSMGFWALCLPVAVLLALFASLGPTRPAAKRAA